MPTIEMGPVLFWRASEFQKHLPAHLHTAFSDYLDWAGSFQTFDETRQKIHTQKIQPKEMTALSLDDSYHAGITLDELLFDASYLLFFSRNYGDIKNNHPGTLNPYLKIWNAESGYLTNQQWKRHFHAERSRETPAIFGNISTYHIHASAKILENKYKGTGKEKLFSMQFVRSLQYFSRRFLDQEREPLIRLASNPEDIVFLATAFESLFDTDGLYQTKRKTNKNYSPRDALREKLAVCLRLNNDKPVSILNKWVDGFYDLRNSIVHGKSLTDLIFTKNPNHPSSFVHGAVNIYLFCTYAELANRNYVPGNFPLSMIQSNIWPYFWTLEDLLSQIIDNLVKFLKEKDREKSFMAHCDLIENEQVFSFCFGTNSPFVDKPIPGSKTKTKKQAIEIRRLFKEKEINDKKTNTTETGYIPVSHKQFLSELQSADL
jgi:hypothetical protein